MKRRVRVVLLEDDQGVRDVLKRILESKGYEALVYEDAVSCPLQHSHECRCHEKESCSDIILTDIDMPNVSGLDFIESQIGKGCKIQNVGVMSGAWSDADRKRAEGLGCKIFEKPVALSALTEWLNECLDCTDLRRTLSDWFHRKA